MFTLPISNARAIAIDDGDLDSCVVYTIDFNKKSIDSFETVGLGAIQSAHCDNSRNLVWIIAGGKVCGVDLENQEAFDIEMPEPAFFAYSIVGEGPAAYVCGEYSNLWRLGLPGLDWTPLSVPRPKPPASKEKIARTLQTKEYAVRYPPYYCGVKLGVDYYFCGALGALARIRNDKVETTIVDTGARFVRGRAEGENLCLSADNPEGQILLGTFDRGFEIIFADTQAAVHLTAIHAGERYIGVAEYPPSDLHNLYVHEENELVPLNTGCAREPLPLISLTSTSLVLWAVDSEGIFRLADGAWFLLEETDIRNGFWPKHR